MKRYKAWSNLSVMIMIAAASGCTRVLTVTDDEQNAGDASDVDAALPVLLTHFKGNPASCPGELPESKQPCFADLGAVCGYTNEKPNDPTRTQYSECTCMAHCGVDEPRWECDGLSSTGGACPKIQPEQGANCFGLKGTICGYPVNTRCECPTGAGEDNWRCTQQLGFRFSDPPTDLDYTKPVNALTSAERMTWCTWFSPEPEPGFPESPDLAPNADGIHPSTSCSGTSRVCATSFPNDLPVSVCVANLAISTCKQPLSELTTCLRWIAGWPTDTRGCAHYLSTPGCAGTIVHNKPAMLGEGHPSCGVRVE